MLVVDPIDTEQIALHREGQHLLIARLIYHHGLQEARVDDVKHVERLADRMDTLAALELDMLESEVRLEGGPWAVDAQKIANLCQVGPQFGGTLPGGF